VGTKQGRGTLGKGAHKLKEEGTSRGLGAFIKQASRKARQGKCANFKRGANPKEGTYPKAPVKLSLRGANFCIMIFCIFSLLLYLLEISIIKFLFYWFSQRGFSRVMLTKNMLKLLRQLRGEGGW
jgi:hypothetical protein